MKSKIEGAKRQTHQTSYSAFGKIILGPAKTPQLWRLRCFRTKKTCVARGFQREPKLLT